MRGIRHPLTGALYELDGTGRVQVTDGEDVGWFSFGGTYLAGTVRHADPHMCVWLSSEPAENRYRTEEVAS